MESMQCDFNITIVSKIHNFIENDAYHNLVEFFEKSGSDGSFLWKEHGSAGWTACHFTASQFVPTEWWEWIMKTASEARMDIRNNFLHCKNALGQTVVDIFFRSYVRPLPWQSVRVKNRSTNFLAALDLCLNGDIVIEEIMKRYKVCQTNRQKKIGTAGKFIRNEVFIATSVVADSRIQRIVDFLIDLQILCRSILHAERENNKYIHLTDEVTFFDALSRTGNCPDKISQLLVRLFPEGPIKATSEQCLEDNSCSSSKLLPILPLHQWCEAHTEFPDDDGILESLLKIPENLHHFNGTTSLASIHDPRSRKLPLLMAVQNGKSWSCLRPLVFADPSVLHSAVFQGLPIFAWTAATSNDRDDRKRLRIQYTARQNVVGEKGMISLWNLARSDVKQIAIQDARRRIDCEQLTSIFESLMACPSALTDLILRRPE